MRNTRTAIRFFLTGVLIGLLATAAQHIYSIGSRAGVTEQPMGAQQDPADTAYQSIMQSPAFNSIDQFLSNYPNSEHITELKELRRTLLFDTTFLIPNEIDVDSLLRMNPCYLPIYKDIDYHHHERFGFSDLFNDSLPEDHPFRNRYLAADLNTTTYSGETKGILEVYPTTRSLREFDELINFMIANGLQPDSVAAHPEKIIPLIDSSGRQDLIPALDRLAHYYTQVGKHRTEPLDIDVNWLWKYRYHAGQHICLCEAQQDTIIQVARFATSAKGWTKPYNRLLPINQFRYYYAPLYTISSRNWEWWRKYSDLDRERDSLLGGGGSAYVTRYENKVQLPNFLLMLPDMVKYKGAMMQNGIHRQALPYLIGGMLGTPNSMGCLRVTDFASKFARWWTPNHAKLFVYIDDERYFHYDYVEDHEVEVKEDDES